MLLALTDTHRRRIGSRTGRMRELIGELHRYGVDTSLTAALERRIAALEEATGARPLEPENAVGAALTVLWVATRELRAKNFAGYGALGERESHFFDEQAALLERDVHELEAAIAGQAVPRSRQGAAEPSGAQSLAPE